jgi:hypothetical protein
VPRDFLGGLESALVDASRHHVSPATQSAEGSLSARGAVDAVETYSVDAVVMVPARAAATLCVALGLEFRRRAVASVTRGVAGSMRADVSV